MCDDRLLCVWHAPVGYASNSASTGNRWIIIRKKNTLPACCNQSSLALSPQLSHLVLPAMLASRSSRRLRHSECVCVCMLVSHRANMKLEPPLAPLTCRPPKQKHSEGGVTDLCRCSPKSNFSRYSQHTHLKSIDYRPKSVFKKSVINAFLVRSTLAARVHLSVPVPTFKIK